MTVVSVVREPVDKFDKVIMGVFFVGLLGVAFAFLFDACG